ncbi:5-oxoprolinase subunit PxpB [Marinimicrobium sp. C6131]|uniref:5-oxoprolinase subunit PxpB n=1 Tax=Marinimicrobium sp. C6131 TaxID=3022676 RepID=UPI00223CE5C6|nr:5-oxoprolinase subunit PxpB [Marinimicrobium sp. C6131]UZJ43301.1 5-oxoprolinase subunit PxpB [Marinimicrobium sp. C6131]
MSDFTLEPAGPDCLLLRFGDRIDPALVPRIRAATDRLASRLTGRVRDLVPSYTTLMVCFDPRYESFDSLCPAIESVLSERLMAPSDAGCLVEIPVYYHPSVGPDLERVAAHHQITIDEVVRLHTAREYTVYTIGFAPGFAYLGEVADELATPRLDSPRPAVPVGSVALADRQTAVYPVNTPGGWNLLGRTALRMFDPDRDNLCPVAPGDRVRFLSISRDEFLAQGGRLDD